MDKYILVFFVLFIFFAMGFKVLRDQERFAVFILGRFKKFKGPGLLFKWPNGLPKWIKVSIGDRGEVLKPDWVRISDTNLPFEHDGSIQVGNFVRIMGFTEEKLIVAYDNNQERSMICKNCGHENILN
jgi:hypothetical protein